MFTAMSLLFAAIIAEVAATSALGKSQGFSDLWWSVFVITGYVLSAWLLAMAVKHISVSIAYAIWAGLGTALVSAVGVLLLGERMDALKAVALMMIVIGVVLLNVRGAH